MCIVSKTKITGNLPQDEISTSIIKPFIHEMIKSAGDIIMALLPILIIFPAFRVFIKIAKQVRTEDLIWPIVYLFRLILFFAGVNAGFMDVGSVVGYSVASLENKAMLSS